MRREQEYHFPGENGLVGRLILAEEVADAEEKVEGARLGVHRPHALPGFLKSGHCADWALLA